MGGGEAPWWVAIAVAAAAGIAGAAGKIWLDLRAEIRQLRTDLEDANQRAAELQERATGAHVRDLRRLTGLSTSVEPPPSEEPPRPRPPPRKR